MHLTARLTLLVNLDKQNHRQTSRHAFLIKPLCRGVPSSATSSQYTGVLLLISDITNMHWCSKSTKNALTSQLVIASKVLSPALGTFFSIEL
jgi:hypothetical protein